MCYATYIATTPEKLWEALTSREFTKKYWFGKEVRSDWKEGSTVNFLDKNGETTDQGQVMKSEPYSLLSYTLKCVKDQTDYERMPRVTFELKPMESTVKLTLKHEYLSTGAFQDEGEGFIGINNGWPAILSNLKSFLETGNTLPEIGL
ncbi:SRPBCC family protein [Virgibacillus sp. JSM 102003]|uniref:SRPBCC family protein n=1 Tax=Virgibacillus sp. JSM 102003 TaxID=1562108 RepID=UPI0035C16B2E